MNKFNFKMNYFKQTWILTDSIIENFRWVINRMILYFKIRLHKKFITGTATTVIRNNKIAQENIDIFLKECKRTSDGSLEEEITEIILHESIHLALTRVEIELNTEENVEKAEEIISAE